MSEGVWTIGFRKVKNKKIRDNLWVFMYSPQNADRILVRVKDCKNPTLIITPTRTDIEDAQLMFNHTSYILPKFPFKVEKDRIVYVKYNT